MTSSVSPTEPPHTRPLLGTEPRQGVAGADVQAGRDEPAPGVFASAVRSVTDAVVRPEVRVESLRPPQKLAPYSYAVSVDVHGGVGDAGDGELATGRLVLLHDPDGHDAWDGVLRLVAYASAELDEQMIVDPMLPTVGWSWLTSALDERGAGYRAAGGTVTQTTSTRFGDLAGPITTVGLELRASWTADSADLEPHVQAFVDMLCTAAGLPPEGVAVLPSA